MIKNILQKIWYKYPNTPWKQSRISYWYYKLLWRMCAWFRFLTPIYINSINVNKIWKEWKSTNGIWKKPAVKYQRFKIHHPWREYPNKSSKWWRILEIQILPLMWKWKFDDIDWEHNPQIYIRLFNYWGWHWMLCSPDYQEDSLYWESICYYLYDKRYCKGNLYRTYENNIYTLHSTDITRDGTKTDIRPYISDDYLEYLDKCIEINKSK